MIYRSRVSAVSAVVLGLILWAAPLPVVAQSETGRRYVAPRTQYGDPDLQGFWTNQTYTQLERPDGVNNPFYTEEEAAAIREGRAVRESSLTEPGTIPDVHYDFTQFGLDRSQATMADNLRTSLIVDPSNGRLPPRTEEGQRRAVQRRAEREARGGPYDAAENLPLGARCIITGTAGPPMLNAGYNSNFHIVQGRDHVMILIEMLHNARIIPLDSGDEPPEITRQWMGLSRGRWEDDTLVVETTNINGKNPFRGSSDRMRVTERFTRVADDAIDYTFTVEDDGTWVRPWTAVMPMTRSRGPLFEHACHEGNYGLTNILAGARAEEARAAAER
ncbi:MAG: hypothetical protein VYE68_10320 [Acidobacteriota bacterium]|nr:hypothetical protein [Acidobacteriota bacterium]